MTDRPRLIEFAFPLQQASLDSVHEKNIRHGHISTLHIWPARRPLAACRAALIATLLPDPGTVEARRALCEKIGGRLDKVIERKKMPSGAIVEREKDVTVGGILHWGRETENAEDLQWFRDEIRRAYGGRAPRVLDPFAGGGAIPLEAMRLGCEATAVDVNPVAWFILKCTLEYPQRLAGQHRPLPDFILRDRAFMRDFLTAQGLKKVAIQRALDELGHGGDRNATPGFKRFEHGEYTLDADLAWHVRAWGRWVAGEARRELAGFYPIYAEFQPLKLGIAYEPRPPQLLELDGDGIASADRLNTGESGDDYLANPMNPRWVAKPALAYLWARTVRCKQCRGQLPLLKTRWLCKKDRQRVLLTIAPALDGTGVIFGVEDKVPVRGGNAAQRREHDKRISAGTMTRSGACCPRCGKVTMTMDDLRLEGKHGRLGQVLTATIVEGPSGKEYRLPTALELEKAEGAERYVVKAFADIPFGLPTEPMPVAETLGFRTSLYGFDQWQKLFTQRQLVAVSSVLRATRNVSAKLESNPFSEGIAAFLALAVDKQVDRLSAQCRWDQGYTKIHSAFARFAMPMLWDFVEGNPLSDATGNWSSCVEWVAECAAANAVAVADAPAPTVICGSSKARPLKGKFDFIITDPPYYDAIPYSDLMDYFYVWLRRTLALPDGSPLAEFREPLAPKWDREKADGEIIDDASRHGGDAKASRDAYEQAMADVFRRCGESLADDGRFVIVFAHKHPTAWATLVGAIIQAGFVVDGSWPIATEMPNRNRALTSAALSSSVWLVGKKRDAAAIPGWDTKVLAAMRTNIRGKLRDFWDAGIRGPDFIWAATGPALEAYSRHPIVKKSNAPGQLMSVSEFLEHVRGIVVEYAVGRVLGVASDEAAAAGDRLDAVTSYYLLHRNDFRLDDAPAGACILYAVSCGLSDRELVATWDLLVPKGGGDTDDDEEDAADDADDADEVSEGSGSRFRLKTWAQRIRPSLGLEAPGGRPVPLIDRLHRLLRLWKDGDAMKVDEFLDSCALRRSELFHRLVQSLIELSPRGSEEKTLLESLSNHIGARGARADQRQAEMKLEPADVPTP